MIFGIFAVVLLLLAIGYNNNLLYLFVFFVISVSWTGMIITNQNLAKIEISGIDSHELHAGEINQIYLILKNVGKSEALDIFISGRNVSGEIRQLKAGESTRCACQWTPFVRGRTQLPSLSIFSTYPFAMLHAWKVFVSENTFIVFPKRSGQRQFPTLAGSSEQLSEVGLFKELRELRNFDSMRRVDWRASLRRQQILIRAFEDIKVISNREFTWESTHHLENNDSRISQLALWVDLAEKDGALYSLTLPGYRSALDQGANHKHALLTQLALFQPLINSRKGEILI